MTEFFTFIKTNGFGIFFAFIILEILKSVIIALIPESFKHFLAKKFEVFKLRMSYSNVYSNVAQDVMKEIAKDAQKCRVELFRKVYAIQFQLLYLPENKSILNGFTEVEVAEEYEKIFRSLKAIRAEIISNMFYSPEFFIMLLSAKIGLHEKAINKRDTFDSGTIHKNPLPYDPSLELEKAMNWLRKEMKTDISLTNLQELFDGFKEVKVPRD